MPTVFFQTEERALTLPCRNQVSYTRLNLVNNILCFQSVSSVETSHEKYFYFSHFGVVLFN